MNTNELQLRHISTGLSIREGESEMESRTIEGHAIVVNTETTLYEDGQCREIEIIDPSCLAESFLSAQDIKLNLLHDRNDTIARCNKGEGNLHIELREDGLHFSVEAPKCDLGERALQLVRDKVYTGCSFEFYPQDYTIEERQGKDGKCEYVIRHTAFRSISALTIALDPAYPTTSVHAREEYLEKHFVGNVETDEEKENREADEAAKQAEAERKLAERQRRMAQLEREMEMLRAQNCNN